MEADKALAEMCRCCSEARTAMALIACVGHKSMHVRSRIASHLDTIVEGCG
jgi:hypothetical protein